MCRKGARGKRVQIRNCFGIDRDGNAATAEAFAHTKTVTEGQIFPVTKAEPRKIDDFLVGTAKLISPA